MKRLVAALVLLISPAVRADALVATMTKDTLYVHRVSAERLDKLLEEKGRGAYAYAWVDATLWVLRKDKAGVTLGKVVDGKVDAVTKPIAGLEVAKLDDVPGELAPGLSTTKSGQVFVTSCIGQESVPGTPYLQRCKLAYYRVDDGSLARAAKPPKDLVFQWGLTKPAQHPPMKFAPKGYKVTIVKTKRKAGTYTGFSCVGPNGHLEWPTEADAADLMEPRFTAKVNKATWLPTKPPIVRIEANGKSPVGEKLHEEWHVLDCKTLVDDVQMLRDGLWMTDDEVRKPTGEVIGKLPGGSAVVSP